MDISRVPGNDNLYIGGINCLKEHTIQRFSISHIVSVIKYDLKKFRHLQDCKHLSIEVDDVEDENLIEYFEKSGAWIEEALRDENHGKPGVVLVHCAMGISRSATIILAYLLRRNTNYEVADALSILRKCRPEVQPNDGFMAQLMLYKNMGCPQDIEVHPQYQSWIYQREITVARNLGVAPHRIRFSDEGENVAQKSKTEKETELRCRKCRKKLATTPYYVQHVPKSSSTSSQTRSTDEDSIYRAECTSYFIHPLSWMRDTLEKGLLSGRLECPNNRCSSLVGRYSWQGQRCSCGTWICPSFSLQKSRCDEVILFKS
ncbi:Tyrosine-protein phosphatase yvh1 [Golovinomyces cichoracearum]|uniref:protein-tyrosine-phosphatase n=1 Tax=Golovinomyces cichoracearum TaxID=62708 RepID=A0A420HBP6_9PEZI|nr:Tyrosine-protein phosphatase yvh1 [Golovinomyces cichoracearum]